MSDKRCILSVTAADCEWSYTKGTGAGGQKRNKTSSAVHCMHRPSGAHGYAEDHREQRRNRELAFLRMVKSPKFEAWRRAEVMRRTGEQAIIDAAVEAAMRPTNIRVECKVDGKWQPWSAAEVET